jgi:hypothetical protein
MSSKQLRRC